MSEALVTTLSGEELGQLTTILEEEEGAMEIDRPISPAHRTTARRSHALITTISGEELGQLSTIVEEEEEEVNMEPVKEEKQATEEQDLVGEPTITSRAVSSSSSSTDPEDEINKFPFTESFPRPGRSDYLEVSWDENCGEEDRPRDPRSRAMARRLVAEAAIARAYDVAWITKVHIRNTWTESNHYHPQCEDHRFLMYAQHIEANFGYKNDKYGAPCKADEPAQESAVIYFGPDDESDEEKLRLWRNGGQDPVVWSRLGDGV
ncbi:uncharacterized protein RAG0_14894 [Rhynchosporium agropyri]|uniref:Uncharacterized protein n=1 Tax=Rhynchosporium agropyri TaxID=914238 RepID=A0A1E1LIQ8_9HELO|nr:uncharacterized protein RAG0_14894 [Rhynchosporium agropyri]